MPSVAAARHDLTDLQWAALEVLLPAGTGRDRPRRWTMRVIIDGIRWRVRTGSPWRDVPTVYPPWQTLYRWFRRWQRDGVWAQILALLQARADAAGLIGWTVSVDSTVARAHQHAAGARRDGRSAVGSRRCSTCTGPSRWPRWPRWRWAVRCCRPDGRPGAGHRWHSPRLAPALGPALAVALPLGDRVEQRRPVLARHSRRPLVVGRAVNPRPPGHRRLDDNPTIINLSLAIYLAIAKQRSRNRSQLKAHTCDHQCVAPSISASSTHLPCGN
ncbi:Transposase [Micromonospora peucetia]|uniref:Transposase n=1 Tax=Micromonospora peucetia TaxID=47871 RepID=A0A1C6W4A3_9ACTN|nr:Transposase [Micromonospora peucetia]